MSFKVYRIRNKETGKFWRRGGGWATVGGAIYTKQCHADLAIARMCRQRRDVFASPKDAEIVEYECFERDELENPASSLIDPFVSLTKIWAKMPDGAIKVETEGLLAAMNGVLYNHGLEIAAAWCARTENVSPAHECDASNQRNFIAHECHRIRPESWSIFDVCDCMACAVRAARCGDYTIESLAVRMTEWRTTNQINFIEIEPDAWSLERSRVAFELAGVNL